MAVTNDFVPPGASLADWARAAHTTLMDEVTLKELTPVFRKNALLHLWTQRGQMKTNVSGRGFSFPVQNRLNDLLRTNGVAPRTFQSKNLWKTGQVESRGYVMTEAVKRKEMKQNRGRNARVQIMRGMVERMKKAVKQQIAPDIWRDGSTAPYTEGFEGMQTFFGVSLSTNQEQGYNYLTGDTESTVTSNADKHKILVMIPSGRYCGLSTAPGNYGGSLLQGTNYVEGECDPEYDAWVPLILNSQTDKFGDVPASGDAFDQYCIELIRYAITHNERNEEGECADVIVADRNMVVSIKNRLDARERSLTTRADGLRAYGISGTFEVDGMEVKTEYAVQRKLVYNGSASSTTTVPCLYGVPSKSVQLLSENDDLVDVEPMTYDSDAGAFKYVQNVDGNLYWGSPRSSFMIAKFVDPTS